MLLLPLRYQRSASLLGFWWWVNRRDSFAKRLRRSCPLILVSQTSSASALDSANIVEEGGGIEPLQLKLYLGFQDRLPTIRRHLPFGEIRENRRQRLLEEYSQTPGCKPGALPAELCSHVSRSGRTRTRTDRFRRSVPISIRRHSQDTSTRTRT